MQRLVSWSLLFYNTKPVDDDKKKNNNGDDDDDDDDGGGGGDDDDDDDKKNETFLGHPHFKSTKRLTVNMH